MTRWSRAWAALSVAAMLAASLPLTSHVAHADPSAADKETARALMAEGRKKRDLGDQKGALEAFRAAHKIMGVPTTGLEVGRTEAALGLLLEARDTLLSVTRIPVKPGEPEPIAKARAEAQTLFDELAPRIPSVKLVVKGAAEGAPSRVFFDGVEASGGVLGVPRKMNPGDHEVAVRIGDVERKTTFSLKDGEQRDVELEFGDAKPTMPIEQPKPKPESHGTNPLVFVGFGLAGVGVIAGSVTGLLHLSKTSSLKDRCPGGQCPPDTHADYDSAQRLGTLSTVSFIVAGVGAGIGVLGLALGAPAPKSETTKTATAPRVVLQVGVGSLGLAGTF